MVHFTNSQLRQAILEVKEKRKRTKEKTHFISSMNNILLVQIYSGLKSFFISAYSFSKETKENTTLLFNLRNRPKMYSTFIDVHPYSLYIMMPKKKSSYYKFIMNNKTITKRSQTRLFPINHVCWMYLRTSTVHVSLPR